MPSELKQIYLKGPDITQEPAVLIEKRVSPTSMLYWWPKVADLSGIRKPKTVFIPTDTLKCLEFLDGKGWPLDIEELEAACSEIGYPVFMRTDHFSGKHSWGKTCFVQNREHLLPNLSRLLDESAMNDLPVNAMVIREYIPMFTLFYAFHGRMPVNPEIRFFARDGKIECWHWYWIPEAIKKSGVPVLDKDGLAIGEERWKFILEHNQESCGFGSNYSGTCHRNRELLFDMVWKVAPQFDGYWSIDFCLSASGEWVLIDMAEGEKSWHPECLVRR